MNTLAGLFAFTLTLGMGSIAFAQDAQPQAAQVLGGAGESCRARTDCKAELKCMNQVCTDAHEGETCGASSDCGGELKCISSKCTSVVGGHAVHNAAGGGGGTDDWMNFKLTGIHPFAGITVGGGFDTLGATGNLSGGFNTFDGTFLFALQGGVFIDNNQITFEIAPYTFIFDGKANGPAFEMNASYAYLIPLMDSGNMHVYWPLRIGAGVMAGGDNTFDLAFFQIRADVIGVAVQIGHAIIDLHLPSFRYFITDKDGAQLHVLNWVFGMSLGYAF